MTDQLTDRLEQAALSYPPVPAMQALLREAAERLRSAEDVIAAARALSDDERTHENGWLPDSPFMRPLREALARWDATASEHE